MLCLITASLSRYMAKEIPYQDVGALFSPIKGSNLLTPKVGPLKIIRQSKIGPWEREVHTPSKTKNHCAGSGFSQKDMRKQYTLLLFFLGSGFFIFCSRRLIIAGIIGCCRRIVGFCLLFFYIFSFFFYIFNLFFWCLFFCYFIR